MLKYRINKGLFHHIVVLSFIISMAMPMRIWIPVGPFASFSILDVVIAILLIFFTINFLIKGKLKTGNKNVFFLLMVPFFMSIFSLLWTVELIGTIKWILIFLEACIVYIITINLFCRYPAKVIAQYMALFVVLCITASVFSYLNIPGFIPQIPPEMDQEGYLLSYFARFSHPFIGLSNNLATVLVFFLLIFIAYGQSEKQRTYLFLGLLTTAGVVLTLSRGVLISMIITFILFFVKRKFILKGIYYFICSSFLLGLVIYTFLLINPIAEQEIWSRFTITNIEFRQEKIAIAFKMIQDKLLLGYGGGAMAYGNIENLVGGVHNTYIEQILNFGLLGGSFIILNLLLLPLPFFKFQTKYHSVKLLARGIGFSVVGQLLIFMTESSFEGSLLRVIFYFSIALSVSLLNSMANEYNHYASTAISESQVWKRA